MCLPQAAVAALSVVQTGLGVAQQAAGHREARREAAARAEAIRARAVADYERIQSRRASERDAASRDLEQSRRTAVASRERVAVAAGEAGVSGRSVAARHRSLTALQGRHRADVEASDLAADRQARSEMRGVAIGAQAQRSTIERPRIPNYWSAGLELISGASKLGHELKKR